MERLHAKGLAKVALRFGHFPLAAQNQSHGVVDIGPIGLDPHRVAVAAQRLVDAAQPAPMVAQIDMSFSAVGLELQGPHITSVSLIVLSLVGKGRAEEVVQVGVARRHFQRLASAGTASVCLPCLKSLVASARRLSVVGCCPLTVASMSFSPNRAYPIRSRRRPLCFGPMLAVAVGRRIVRLQFIPDVSSRNMAAPGSSFVAGPVPPARYRCRNSGSAPISRRRGHRAG